MVKSSYQHPLLQWLAKTKTVLWLFLLNCFAFLRYLGKRVSDDRITVNASALAYTTLLSLVPLITVVFSVMSAFPIFESWQQSVEAFLYTNLVPHATGTIQEYLQDFVANTGKMTSIGSGALFMVALLLINTIDKHINHIWRCKIERSFFLSFAVYWLILTFGPLFIAISLGISSYLLSLSFVSDVTEVTGIVSLLKLVPALLGTLGLFVMYVVIPHRHVPLLYAFIGASISALLFEGIKRIFTWYLVQFPSYEVIYGALATIPILLVWIYLCWLIVLLGAEITASLTEFDEHKKAQVKLKKQSQNQQQKHLSMDASSD
ncbi:MULTISPECIES: virulence factor BrkB family protein [unclassified Moritella]|uniref:virulence factor BrkB family protein n=1 Tax=unclassified Moritella TaxID=2637987 RepID=UPI001BABF226|nr:MULTISPECIES: virulence factor BrkB family protein [unclassified Moritella]QUM86974.1 virulence factor BrkB family protein [Moritella sp. 28]QUM91193.1 virulence factor BrkB family protein [Moritella sp. 36]